MISNEKKMFNDILQAASTYGERVKQNDENH